MKISFLMPAYNAADTIGAAIQSIIELEGDFERRIIVVDDGSVDGTYEAARAYRDRFPAIIELVRQPNRGESAALNAALARADGDYIALVESDVRVSPKWLSLILAEFSDGNVMGAGGRLLTPGGANWIERVAGYDVDKKFASQPREARHITSANAVYRSEAFRRFGAFDEGLYNSCLDADLNQRILAAGYKLIYVKDAIAWHHYKSTLGAYLKRNYLYARYRPHLKGDIFKSDIWIRAQVIGVALLLASFAALFWMPVLPLLMFVLLVLFHLPDALCARARYGLGTAIVYPFVGILKGLVGVVGAVVGYFNKLAGRY
jgi:glycosyltransferase involved in cell wall biosynthesis